MSLKIILAIGAGGFIGSILRYMLSVFVQSKAYSSFPYGTLSVNVIGCFAIGMVFALTERTTIGAEWRLFLATGICGGFTTFSALSQETFGMLRDGQYWLATLYVSGSFIFGLLATFVGYTLFKFFG